MLKRIMDITLSSIGIILVLPVFPIIALLIKLDSRGPVFFLVDRIGKGMKGFRMFKFRTMIETPLNVGGSLCPQYDPRVTSFGRLLRRSKLNEFPQLLNIFKGEMTFVGPRPESPDLAALYPSQAKEIFSVKPGLVGPNQILGRNEEEMYPPGVDVKRYYIEHILPQKMVADLEYIKSPTFINDLKYVLLGVKETLIGAVSRTHIQDNRSQIYLLFSDMLLCTASFALAYCFCFLGSAPDPGLIETALFLAAFLAVQTACFAFFGLYRSLIRYISYHDILAVLKGVTAGSLLVAVPGFFFGLNGNLKLFIFVDWASLLILLSGLRFCLRFYWEKKNAGTEEKKRHRVLIYGAGKTGFRASRAMTADKEIPVEVMGFIDDAPDKYGKKLNGIKILGNRHHIKALTQLYRVNEIILAFGDGHGDEMSKIIKICRQAGLQYRLFSSPVHTGNGSSIGSPVRGVALSDVLSLESIHMDTEAVKSIVGGKTVLVNGAGSAFGFELCTQILGLGCRKLIITDRYDSYLNELTSTLIGPFSDDRIIPVFLGTDGKNTLQKTFQRYVPEIVFQTGMRKFIPIFKGNSDDVVRSNYERTLDLARLSQVNGCKDFVLISSFEAASGGHLVPESLRISELMLQEFFRGSGCRLVISRICDILENRGGLVSMIDNRMRNREAITLPSPHTQLNLISRYSGAQFVLQTLVEADMKGNGLFVCEPDVSLSVSEVTTRLSRLYGLNPGKDLAITYRNMPEMNSALRFEGLGFLQPAFHPKIRHFMENGLFDSPERKTLLMRFLSPENMHLQPADWKRQTRELVNLCGQALFEGHAIP